MDEALRNAQRILQREGGLTPEQMTRLGEQFERFQRYEQIRQEELARQPDRSWRSQRRAAAHARRQTGLSRNNARTLRGLTQRAAAGRLRAYHVAAARALASAGRIPPALAVYLANPAILGAFLLGAFLLALYLSRDPEPEPQVASAVDCDCENIDAGILNRGWIPACEKREAELRKLESQDALGHKTEDGSLVAGEFCSPTPHGPAAWPIKGAPVTTPSRR
jgi:hypothetical protein